MGSPNENVIKSWSCILSLNISQGLSQRIFAMFYLLVTSQFVIDLYIGVKDFGQIPKKCHLSNLTDFVSTHVIICVHQIKSSD